MTLSATLVEPAYFTHPDYFQTFGPEVGELAALANFPPDPEQQLVLDPMFGVDRYGKSAAFEVAVIGSRQNIKTGLLKIAALGKTVVMERPLFVWSAHEFRTAQESFRDLTVLIESCPDLDQMVRRIYRGNGDESIEWLGGQRIIFKARTKSGGRGLTGDDVGLDEGFALTPEHMGALLPTLSARPDPQVFYGSSAGLADSDVLRGVRDRGRAGSSPRLVYVEWCAPEGGCLSIECDHHVGSIGCVLDDEAKWQLANPQLGRRITIDYVRAERQAMPPAEFARERLGWWDDPTGEGAIPRLLWAALTREAEITFPSFVLDVSPKMTHAALAVAGQVDGTVHTSLVLREGEDQVDSRPGVDWVIPAVRDLASRTDGVHIAIAANSQAWSLKADLEAIPVIVDVIPAADVAAACGLMFNLIVSHGVTHSAQIELDTAVAATQWRDTGEGAQVWGRRRSGEITAFYAVTLAVWIANQAGEPLNNIF